MITITALVMGCETSDPSEFTDEDEQAILEAFEAAMDAAEMEVEKSSPDSRYEEQIQISIESPCALGGRITSDGNVTVWADGETGSSGFWGQVIMQVSDPTNNLNDCVVENGLILDGTLMMDLGGEDGSFTVYINGSIGVNRLGDGGGLVPVDDDCGVTVMGTDDNYSTVSICPSY